MDELKKYLQQHIDKLDVDEPGERVWEQIRTELPIAKKTVTIQLITRWAVAACVLVLAGIGTWSLLKNGQGHEQAAQPIAQVSNKPADSTPKEAATQGTEPKETPVKELIASNSPSKEQTKPAGAKKIPAANSNASLRLLNDVESSFIQVINLQRARVSSTPMYAETPAYFNDFKVQIKQMEHDEKQIKADIAKQGLNDELLDQLINLYQQKLNTLKQLQIEMNKTNNRYKQHSGPVDSTHTYFLNI
jgi:hypothetical protein